MKKNILLMTALLGATVWTGCQKIEEELVEIEPAAAYTLVVEATKGADTKALSLDGNTLNAHWADGEQVAVYLGGTKLGMLTATPDGSDASKATLAGTLDSVNGVTADVVLTLLFPRAEWDYTGQDGAAPTADGSLSTKYDYAMASVTVASVNSSSKTITVKSAAQFQNQQSMYCFSFGPSSNNLIIKQLTLFSEFDKLVQSRSWNGSDWEENYGPITITVPGNETRMVYASLRNMRVGTSGGDYLTFTLISDDQCLYMGNIEVPNSVLDVQGKFISARNKSVGIAKIPRDFTSGSTVNKAL